MTAALLLLLKAAVGVIIFAIGLDSTADDALFLPRRPGLLLRSLLAMYVVVPLAALMLVGLLDLAPGVELGLLVLAALGRCAAAAAQAAAHRRRRLHLQPGAAVLAAGHRRRAGLADAARPALPRPAGTGLDRRRLGAGQVLPAAAGRRHAAGPLAPDFAEYWSSRLIGAAGGVLTAAHWLLLVLHWDVLLVARWAACWR